ncbi:MAG: zinc-binding dehydrogenase [Burkholderiaceae bacterium]
MTSKSKVALLVENRKIELDEYAIPNIGADAALLRVEQAGLCGTDYKLYAGGLARKYPIIPGHEILGFIERAGPEFARRHGVKVGDRVVVEATIPCGHCRLCNKGDYRLCVTGRFYGFTDTLTPPHLWGAFAQYMYIAPGSFLTKISHDISADAATVAASTLGNGIRWMRSIGDADIGKPVVIQGVGAQGLCAIIAAKESGAYPIIATGISADVARLAFAKELGADLCVDVQKEDVVDVVRQATGGVMAASVLDVTGSPEAIALSVKLARTQGTVVCASSVSGNRSSVIDTNELVRKEVRFQGVWTHSLENTQQAMQVAKSGKYPLERFISHAFGLDEAEKAVRSIGREIGEIDPIKVAINPW